MHAKASELSLVDEAEEWLIHSRRDSRDDLALAGNRTRRIVKLCASDICRL